MFNIETELMLKLVLGTIAVIVVLFFAAVVALAFLLLISDRDLTLGFYDYFGQKARRMRGKVVWITGASSGIGEHLAYELASAGCKMVLTARRREELERVKKQCLLSGRVTDEDIFILDMDMLDLDYHAKATAKVIEKFDHVDILVNNAGRSARQTFSRTHFDVYRECMELNYFSVLALCKTILPHFKKNESGHFVFTSSFAGKLGAAGLSTYAPTKHALHGCFESVRQELYEHGIYVTMICPGPVFSDALKHAFTDTQGNELSVEMDPSENRVKTSRCAHLMAVAMVNQLDEVWISNHPELFYMYLFQYMPTIARRLSLIIGKKRVERVLAGEKNLHA